MLVVHELKIPRKIKVGPHVIKCTGKRKVAKDESSLGYARYCHDVIEYATTYEGKDMQESKVTEIFLHELIHQIDDKYSINMNERQTHLMSAGLLQVIRDNKLDLLDKS